MTATFSNVSPANASTNQNYDGRLSADITPAVYPGNPVLTVTCTLNGYPCVVTTASLGPSGALRASGRGPARAGKLNAVVWSATTQDTTVTTNTSSYTARRAWGPTRAGVDLAVLPPAVVRALADYAVRGSTATRAIVDYAVLPSGITRPTAAVVDYAVQNRAGGLLNSLPALVDYYAVDPVLDLLTPIGMTVAETHRELQPIGGVVYGTDRQLAVPIGCTPFGQLIEVAVLLGLGVRIPVQEVLLYLGCSPAIVERDVFPVGLAVDRTEPLTVVEVTAVSTRRAEVEEEP